MTIILLLNWLLCVSLYSLMDLRIQIIFQLIESSSVPLVWVLHPENAFLKEVQVSSKSFWFSLLNAKRSQEASVWRPNPVNVRMKACPQHHSMAWPRQPTDPPPPPPEVVIPWLIDQTLKPLMWISMCTQSRNPVKTNVFPKTAKNDPMNPFTSFLLPPFCQVWNSQVVPQLHI